jgi:hypothetical protein
MKLKSLFLTLVLLTLAACSKGGTGGASGVELLLFAPVQHILGD